MILGFDFGMKYIGVATGQLITKTATPLTCLRAKDGIPDWQVIADLIEQWRPEAIVVGLPLNMDGSAQLLSNCANKFANRIKDKFNVPIHLVDERLSTWQAKQELGGHKRNLNNKQLTDINAKAAAIILQQWLLEK